MSIHDQTHGAGREAGEAHAALRDLADRLRSWGDNDPDPEFFNGDVLVGVLIDCGHAAEALAEHEARLAAAEKRATVAEAELDAVDRAFEGLEETDRARRIGHWIGTAADAETNLLDLARMYGEACGALLKARLDRVRTDRRIRCQRAALRENWEIVEQRIGVAAHARLYRYAAKRSKAAHAAEAQRPTASPPRTPS